MSDESDGPKLHIDSDWKAQAQAEKERLAAKEAEHEQQREANGGRGELPDADFRALMGLLASQAVMGLGAYTDPESGGVVVDLPGSRFAIDLLDVLKEKTEGNRSDEETQELDQLLGELRTRFVQIAELVKQQGGAAGGSPTGGPPMGGPPIQGVDFQGGGASPVIETP